MMQNRNHTFTGVFATALCMLFFSYQGLAQQPVAATPNKLSLPAETHAFTFAWRGDSLHGRWDAYSAMLIPVSLPNCPRKFYMQFDLGSGMSMFYGPALQTIKSRYPDAVKETGGVLHNISFSLGAMPVAAEEISVKQFGDGMINWADTTSYAVIGTIGADLFGARFLLIDYPAGKITTGAEVPASFSKNRTLPDLVFAGGRILLPARIRDKQQLLYFDTGSSAFALMTDKPTSEMLAAPGEKPVGFSVSSWGRQLSAFTLRTNDSILIASQNIPLHETTYVEGASNSTVEQMMRAGITGLTGNKLFLDKVLLIDLRNRKFGVF